MLSEDIVERLGKPAKIQLLTNGSQQAFAICPATAPDGAATLSQHGRQSEFRVFRLMTALKKDATRITWPLDLPHRWEGNFLVIDVSEVPNAPAAREPLDGGQ